MESELAEVEGSGIFYPRKLEFRTMVDGQEDVSQLIFVRKVSFEPVPQTVFSIFGMDLVKPGTQVEWNASDPPPGNGKLIWDGTQIREEREVLPNADGLLPNSGQEFSANDVISGSGNEPSKSNLLSPWLRFNFGLGLLFAGGWWLWNLFSTAHRKTESSA